MVKSEICGFSVCRNFVWPWKFPFGAFIFLGKSLPSLDSQCHSSLLLHVLDLYISMFVCLSEPIPALLGANDKRGCYKKGPPLKPRHSLSHCICSCLCTWKKKKKACIIFLWALRFILFCCQTFGNAFYKLYWDKISRDVCICLSSAQYYFLMHFWLCRQRIQ